MKEPAEEPGKENKIPLTQQISAKLHKCLLPSQPQIHSEGNNSLMLYNGACAAGSTAALI